ncbi:hypothetical protein [Dyadobacter aurulentus]|uniref:hypothetical protein n=1 Tax=Dyadobacter sp. UC 10 TaxID=2605428 RepID=UPI001788C99D|nr:hypothetical protein [Dyadobacter sp. UC 10]
MTELTSIFIFQKNELENQNDEYSNITKEFTCKVGLNINTDFNKVGDINEYQIKPIIRLEDDSYFIPMPYFLAESFYNTPYYWMIEDKSYKNISLTNRGIVAEDIGYNILSKKFGDKNIFKRVKIQRNKTHTQSDIDILLLVDNTAIVFQVKTKRITNLSREGNLDKIHNDFALAIESAYLQGVEAEKCIKDYTNYTFIDESRTSINGHFEKVRMVLVVCLVLDGFPSLSFATHQLLYEKCNKPVLCIDIFDLQVLVETIPTATMFRNYLLFRAGQF